MATPWQISVDTGGTFTDLIGVDPNGRAQRAKVLSNASLRALVAGKSGGGWLKLNASWGLPDGFFKGFLATFPGGESLSVLDYRARDKAMLLDMHGRLPPGSMIELSTGEEAPILGARVMTRTPGDQPLPPMNLRLGTTRGTNALLERKGTKTVLFVTEGFGDLLAIGDQRRPDLFALNIEKPVPLISQAIEVTGRLDADGKEIVSLKLDQTLWDQVNAVRASGCKAAAVALLHSYRNPVHEQALAQFLAEAGFKVVTLSSQIAPFIKLLPRAQTAVVDAYLSPVMNTYLNQVQCALGSGRLRVMTSAGGLVARESFRAKDALLSGPAGGVVGAVASGQQAGYPRVIAFDMGGTSTDVSRSEGDFDYRSSHRVGDASILAPALKIETVAAGGGSICGWDGRKLFVGPDSAGAHPGPACYGAGGPLTVTDVNLLLGRVLPEAFSIPVYPDHASKAADAIACQADIPQAELLTGFLRIANERMAAAIETISVREGYDPREYALVAFGGAGGLHACAIADELGMDTVLFPPHAGILSAYGIQQARVERIGERQVMRPLVEVQLTLGSQLKELAAELRCEMQAEGLAEADLEVRQQRVTLRLDGQESTLTIDYAMYLAAAFQREYEQVFGYFPQGRSIEVVALQVVISTADVVLPDEVFSKTPAELSLRGQVREGFAEMAILSRDELPTGASLDGPAIIYDETCTLFIEAQWRAVIGSNRTLRMERKSPAVRGAAVAEAVARELFTNRFRQVVDEMGVQLERTAVSTNVKERLDFSCALLDGQGRLVANAPHIPVHLGALGLCVRTIAQQISLSSGDVIVTNHPGYGGSHLPDVTVITPVFYKGRLIAYVANRAHHAELGGIRPGSMPPNATCLAEEGVVIPPMYLFRAGESQMNGLEALLRNAPYPSRAVEDNIADLNAQVAANRRGEKQVLALAKTYGADAIEHYMQSLLDFSTEALRSALSALPAVSRKAVSVLDDGQEIHVSLEAQEGALIIDFAQTSKSHPGNLNATPAIVSSALIYVLRLLVSEDIPLNEGLLVPVSVKLPRCFLNPEFPDDPREAPAVVGGNVETSQRVVECCLRALGIVADSQGTMNNFIFGNDTLSYYETIGGGAGASNGYEGASGVHTHMTNTAITDPEILERRYPLRLWRFALRVGSGGCGRWRGGDGLVREVEFLTPVSVSLLTQHRARGPRGRQGGGDGAPGRQVRMRLDGHQDILSASVDYEAQVGERLCIETPGGGGFGA
ncbi:hydantoinase B/oxoprolinase family protein [Cerasicoccus arenae]|uniref:5-oxoprolinase n=1 Tax=Cerasicoccus arenae TaxID=424488 RepID=A0A8J3DAD5_9BACT|nr:hydantoinase B/oxoprolinase family protein [Cerasicoccus arenae]MBK1858112.1 hydantoinase B/oxoprolinase family protein [Cerasicoccus arenae]GHB96548.1 5-oxoprolinase [Cerasicoccus arenae]